MINVTYGKSSMRHANIRNMLLRVQRDVLCRCCVLFIRDALDERLVIPTDTFEHTLKLLPIPCRWHLCELAGIRGRRFSIGNGGIDCN